MRALKAGHHAEEDAADGARLPARTTILRRIVLMGYYNPIYIYGVDPFLV